MLEKIKTMLEKPAEDGKGVSANAVASIESIIQAQEAERQRLSRQMHDCPAQALFCLHVFVDPASCSISSPSTISHC